MPVKLGQGVVFRPGTAFDERWAPNQFLSGFVTSIFGDDASIVVFPDAYEPFYEMRVKRDDALSQDRTWTPAVGESQTMPEAPSDGQIYGRRNQAWTPVTGEDQGFIQCVVISDTQPVGGLVGMAWLDTTINNFYIFEQGCWIEPAHVNPVVAVSVNITPPVISGNVVIGGVLTSTTGDWSSMPISYAYQWRRGLSPVVGASNPTYVISAADLDFEITCAVTAINQVGQSQPALSNALMIASPKNLELPVISGNVAVGQVFTTTDGVWMNDPAIVQFTYQWLRNGVAIAGATLKTYTIAAEDVGFDIACLVTATNLIGSTPVTSKAVLISAPTIVDPPILYPTVEGTGIVLFAQVTCPTGVWTGLPTGYTYQWKRDGVNIVGQTINQYSLATADLGHNVVCIVTATNMMGSTPASSDTISLPAATTYTKFDPATILNVTLEPISGLPDLRVRHSNTSTGGAKSTALKTSGKWFFQGSFGTILGDDSGIGLLLSSGTYADMVAGANCVKLRQKLGEIWTNGVYSGRRLGGLAGGHSFSAAIDLDNRLVWFRTDNGIWNGLFNEVSAVPGVSGGISFGAGSFAPAICYGGLGAQATEVATFNFGTTGFNQPPDGFTLGWTT